MKKRKYIPPTVEVFVYMPEKGYAASYALDNTDIVFDVSDSLENVTEGKNYSLFGDDTWF